MDSFLNAVGIQRVLHRDLCERFQRNFAQRGNFLRHIAHVRRLIPRPRTGSGERYGLSVSIRMRSSGTFTAASCNFGAFLKVTGPAKLMKYPSFRYSFAISQLPEKQWMMPPVRCFLWRFMMSSMS